jgi:hypothetical protein
MLRTEPLRERDCSKRALGSATEGWEVFSLLLPSDTHEPTPDDRGGSSSVEQRLEQGGKKDMKGGRQPLGGSRVPAARRAPGARTDRVEGRRNRRAHAHDREGEREGRQASERGEERRTVSRRPGAGREAGPGFRRRGRKHGSGVRRAWRAHLPNSRTNSFCKRRHGADGERKGSASMTACGSGQEATRRAVKGPAP